MMFKVQLSRSDIEKKYFKDTSIDQIKKLLYDGKAYYTEDGWNLILLKAQEVGISEEEIELREPLRI